MRRTTRVAAWVAVVLAAGAGLARANDARQPPAAAEQAFADRIAAERAGRGLAPLSSAPDLVEVARRHAAEMAGRGSVYHNPRLGEEVRDWEVVGENVGAGHDVDQLHAAFMASAVHRDEVLFAAYRDVGIGVAYGADGRLYVTQVFRQPAGVAAAAAPPATDPVATPAPATTEAPLPAPPPPARIAPQPTTTSTLPPAPPAPVVAEAPAPVPPVEAAAPPPALVSPADVVEEIPPAAAVAAALLLAVVAAQGLAVRRLGLA